SPFTDHIGSIDDREFVTALMPDVRAIAHAATLHKPHVATHSARRFIDTNVAGTLTLLDAAVAARVEAFVFTSTTSAFGAALTPAAGGQAAWVTEDVAPVPRNIYGVTKVAAEDLCELFHRRDRLPVVVLRTSRFFPEADDDAAVRGAYATANVQVNELLHRRVDLDDVVDAHLLAVDKAPALGFGRYVVSATTPFTRGDLATLRSDAPAVVRRLFPDFDGLYAERGWSMFPGIDRVYDNARARSALGWRPRHDFRSALDRLSAGVDFRSGLAITVGSKGYHDVAFAEGPYPVA
ncbi:MAG: NAD(P)-dependent oxidoreductase, partial [Rhodospirillales bacterium]|nr:NAD(P)-dependent oxidoreductase [Rhodospirillales bacterium]